MIRYLINLGKVTDAKNHTKLIDLFSELELVKSLPVQIPNGLQSQKILSV